MPEDFETQPDRNGWRGAGCETYVMRIARSNVCFGGSGTAINLVEVDPAGKDSRLMQEVIDHCDEEQMEERRVTNQEELNDLADWISQRHAARSGVH